MAGQWRSTATCGGTLHGKTTPRWLSALGADREAQSFDWPTAAQQSWSQSPSAAADATVPMNTNAPLQDRQLSPRCFHSDPQLGSRRLHSVILDHPATPPHPFREALQDLDPRLDTEDSHAGPPLSPLAALPLLCSSRFAGPPGLPLPPALEVQTSSLPPPEPSRYVSHRQTTPVPPMREHQLCHILPVRMWNMPAPLMRERLHSAPNSSLPVPPMREGRNADTSPSPSRRRVCFPCCASHTPGSMDQSHLMPHAAISCTASTVSPCFSGLPASPQERHADPPCSLWSFPRSDPPGSGRSRVIHLGDFPRLAQQRHVRVRRRCLPHLRSLHKQRHMGTCCSCRTWLASTPIRCRLSHSHVLFSSLAQQSHQET